MNDVWKVWLKHRAIWAYALIAFALMGVLIQRGALFEHWYLLGVLILVPFYEWLVHKYFLHFELKSKNPRLQDFLEKIHEGHHVDPRDKVLVFAPFIVGLQVPLSFFLIALLVGGSLDQALTLAIITLCYYLFYEWMHLAHHTESYKPRTKLGSLLKQAHTWHHYKNENYWWGVTSIFGDKILGTYPNPKNVPRSHSVKDLHGHGNSEISSN